MVPICPCWHIKDRYIWFQTLLVTSNKHGKAIIVFSENATTFSHRRVPKNLNGI